MGQSVGSHRTDNIYRGQFAGALSGALLSLSFYRLEFQRYLINIIGTIIVVGLGIGTFIGFSMIGAGVLILTKQGDPVTTIITLATNLFGNVLFPITVMPIPLQIISFFVPQYYFFTCIRPMLIGQSIVAILPDLAILGLMCTIILPVGYQLIGA
jgi:ABC-2 type transport system permease protein